MTEKRPAEDPLADALLAAQLFLIAPKALVGLCLRGGGQARDLVVEAIRDGLPKAAPFRRLPPHIDDERLLGGIDVAASLVTGKSVRQAGLLEEVEGGVLAIPMAERLRDEMAGRLAQTIDGQGGFGLILLDDGIDHDERAPANLRERLAFECDLGRVTSLEIALSETRKPFAISTVAELSDDLLAALAGTGALLGVDSVRALIFAATAARAHAALHRRKVVKDEDLQVAARLVLAPRATQLPPSAEEQEAPPPQEQSQSEENHSEHDISEIPPEDLILEAALAAIPQGVLDQISAGKAGRGSRGGGAGKRAKSKLRGKPLGARPGRLGAGARLALIDTLRAAVPWQPLRRRESPEVTSNILVRKDDLRIRRFEERSATVTVFCVDASGSAAIARLAEAKGAVELILAQAYVKRSEVALIAFRGEGADLLLPPTRSLTRAKRALAELPGGGGTPLASGIALSAQLAQAITSRGSTPFIVFLTDGSANIAADGTPGRALARDDALAAAKLIAARKVDSLVIDISPRARPDAQKLAEAMLARYLPLPFADAEGLQRAVLATRPERAPV